MLSSAARGDGCAHIAAICTLHVGLNMADEPHPNPARRCLQKAHRPGTMRSAISGETMSVAVARDWDLEFVRRGILNVPRAGVSLRDVSVGADEEVISIWSDDREYWAMLGTDGEAVALGEIDARDVQVELMSDGRILVWCAREHLVDGYGSASKPNAWLYAPDGTLLRDGSLGDAIEHTLTGPNGSIWVGYFDEGALSGGELEQHGLVCFDDQFEPVWQFPNYADLGPIADCYALNVDRTGVVTLCAYDEWNIVTIVNGQGRAWKQGASGASSIIQAGSRIALVSGYSGERDRVCWLELEADGTATEVGRGRVTGVQSFELGVPTICRGDTVHAFVRQEVYAASIA